MMQPPQLITVPTCIGCGAMSVTGTCEAVCAEHKLELVRAAARDALVGVAAGATARADALEAVIAPLSARGRAPADLPAALAQLRERAAAALRRLPDDPAADAEWEEPAEPHTTWWCDRCGGVDAPQECLGICIWRPIEYVDAASHAAAVTQAREARAREARARALVRRVANVRPRAGRERATWAALRAATGSAP